MFNSQVSKPFNEQDKFFFLHFAVAILVYELERPLKPIVIPRIQLISLLQDSLQKDFHIVLADEFLVAYRCIQVELTELLKHLICELEHFVVGSVVVVHFN